MSNEIFPNALSGYVWDSKKKPLFNNITHSPPTGRDVRIALYTQPIFEFTLSNAWMSKADKDLLIGFFLARQGSFDTFLYTDEDSAIVDHQFAVGNGVSYQFQLGISQGGFVQMVNNPVGNPSIYLDSVLLEANVDYTLNSSGVVTLLNIPTNGVVLSWTGSAYYRCVFMDDALEYNQFANLLYDCNEIQFKGCLANKL